jgi:hypothetical protein
MCLLRGIGCRWLVAAVLMVRAGVPAQPIAGANPPDSLKPRLGASPGRAGRTAHLGTQGPLPRARVDVGISKGQGGAGLGLARERLRAGAELRRRVRGHL